MHDFLNGKYMLFSLLKKIHVKNTGQPDPTRNPIDPTRSTRFAISRYDLNFEILVLGIWKFCIDHWGHSKGIPHVKIFLGFGLKFENFCCLKRLYSGPKHGRYVVRTYFCESDILLLLIITVKSSKWWESQMFLMVIPNQRLCV